MGRTKDFSTLFGWGLTVPLMRFIERFPELDLCEKEYWFEKDLHGVKVYQSPEGNYVFICVRPDRIDCDSNEPVRVDPQALKGPPDALVHFIKRYFPNETPQLTLQMLYRG